ncbi:DUF6351 family protein [soil metagenome]
MTFLARLTGSILMAATLAACAGGPAAAQAAPTPAASAPHDATCPEGLPAATKCYSGRSDEGAFYWIAIPADWNGTLVMHAHGGPRTQAPEQNDPVEDLQRFAVTVREGFAWAGSSYRRGGYGVRMAAEDTDILRQIFSARFGKPQHTLLHGQSWGGNVAAKAAELYAIAADGANNYDGVMLSAGLVAGGTRGYGFRADLRAVYQFYCHNHPRTDEAQYPVWQGLPAGASMSRAQLTARVDECTGVSLPAARRTPQQASNLRNILAVTGVPEPQLIAHLAWATNLFQDMVHKRLGGLNPFSNADTVYSGSDDDAALNAGVERFTADPAAVARLAYDADLSGLIVLPTLSIHAKKDPTVYVGVDAIYRETVARAGRSDLLVQTFTDEDQHSRLSTPEYAALLESLMAWITSGEKPDPASVAASCERHSADYGEPCLFDTGFTPTLP